MAAQRAWLKRIRKEKGYTGPSIARELGISSSTWYGYETGYRTPTGKDALRIANLLGFDIENFFYEYVRDKQPGKEVI